MKLAGTGKVWLIGAGPGDPELLTLKAVRVLGAADVVLLDDLVNREILTHAPQARVIEVGKRGPIGSNCGKSTPQAFIERQMIALAQAGKAVVRLKGGDPCVFGRGGEEMLALARAGVDFEVVPGVTAGIGVPAALGIPVTHRGCAHGVTLVSGHLRDGAEPNWDALTRSGTTLVIYMGVANLGRIRSALLSSGMPGATPAAAIQNGTLPDEKHVLTTLTRIERDVTASAIASPAILVIGAVVDLAKIARHARLQQLAA